MRPQRKRKGDESPRQFLELGADDPDFKVNRGHRFRVQVDVKIRGQRGHMGYIRRDLNSAMGMLVVSESILRGHGRPYAYRRRQPKPRPIKYIPGVHPGWYENVYKSMERKWQTLQARFGG